MNTHLVQVSAARTLNWPRVYFSLCSLLTDEHYGDGQESFYITRIKLSESPERRPCFKDEEVSAVGGGVNDGAVALFWM